MTHKKLLQILPPAFLIAALTVSSALSQSDQLTPQEKRGQQIYLKGTGSSEITALLGNEGTEVPASVLACAGCHGHDGRGKPEGGITPSNITWQSLTKPYGVTHASGRKHPPYTERFLKRAISMGTDPAGNALHAAMPRYRMPLEDMDDLIAYIKRLGMEMDPGLTDTTIRVGAILPPFGRLSEMGQAIRGTLTAYFEEINKSGGVYNRRIELSFIESPENPEERVARVRELLEKGQAFALTSGFIAGADREIASLIEEAEVPLIGAFTLYPQTGFPLNRYVFYLYSGLANQGRALATFAAKKNVNKNPPAAIIHSDDKLSLDVAEAIKQQCQKSGWDAVEDITIAAGQFDAAPLVQRLKQKGVEAVFFLGPPGAEGALIQESLKFDWKPMLLIPGSLAGRDIFEAPESFEGRIFLSFPTLPSDQTPDGAAEYQRLAEAHKLHPQSLATQLTALSSAKALVEGLERAGRDVSREKLIEEIEKFYGFQTGMTPAITYGPNRRIGSLGSHIVSVDLKAKSLSRTSEWVEPK